MRFDPVRTVAIESRRLEQHVLRPSFDRLRIRPKRERHFLEVPERFQRVAKRPCRFRARRHDVASNGLEVFRFLAG